MKNDSEQPATVTEDPAQVPLAAPTGSDASSCPFCGSTKMRLEWGWQTRYAVCESCQARGPAHSSHAGAESLVVETNLRAEKAALDGWNTRQLGVKESLALCHRLRDGAARMTRQQFRNALTRSIGSTKDYSDNVRPNFQDNPAAFLAHRNPQSQSEELLRVILEITKHQNNRV